MSGTKGAFRAGRVLAADSKHTGEEPDWTNWKSWSVEKFMSQRFRMLNFYSYYLVGEDLQADIATWMLRNNYAKDDVNLIKNAHFTIPGFTIGKFARCLNRGMPAQHPEAQAYYDTLTREEGESRVAPDDNEYVRKAVIAAIAELKAQAIVPKDEVAEKKPRLTIFQALQAKVEREVIVHLDHLHDMWSTSQADVEGIALTSLIRDNNTNTKGCTIILDWLNIFKAEYQAAFDKTDAQLVEGYSYLTSRGLKSRLKAIDKMIDEVNKVANIKKAMKAPRVKKTKDASKQVLRMKYQIDSQEYDLTSIPAIRVPTSHRLFSFNTKYRTLTFYEAKGQSGFEVKGSSLIGWNTEASFTVTLRKPKEFLNSVLTLTPKTLSKFIETLPANHRTPNGRFNEHSILLRTLEAR